MLDQPTGNDGPVPGIDFSDIIKCHGRSSSTVERQVTVSRYRTYSTFNFGQVQSAVQKCKIKASDDFGIIGVRTSKDNIAADDPIQNPEHIKLDVGDEWVRALFAVIGDKSFRWLDFESQDIFEYLIEGVLDETFLVEYYQDDQKELRFLTYGASRFSERINSKHRFGFGMHFASIQEDFSHEFIRRVCSRPEFIRNLRSISYDPEGEAGYGTVEVASMKTKYQNVIDPGARRVEEILNNAKILISEFGSKFSIYSPYVANTLSIRFDISVKGLVTLYLPEIKFSKPMTDIERENALYEIVRSAYAYITGGGAPCSLNQLGFLAPPGQLVFDFIQDIE
jgi:hypothetical protein